ncbi:MAG: YgiT-type zinc finger protein [Lachnospiraceae bacterium]|nr:YgiT-type zinc finger protein [Lachnospiraceae bacterium]
MKCIRCGKEVYTSTTTEAIEYDFGVLVVRKVPCYKCKECDEIILTGDVVAKLEKITETMRKLANDVSVVDFSKAA